MNKILSILMLTIFVFSTASAVVKMEDYGLLPSAAMMRISPSGDRIAFRKSEKQKDMLIVYSLVDKKVIKGIDVTEVNPRSIDFLSDHQIILRVEDSKLMYGDNESITAAYVLDLKTGDIKQLLVPGKIIHFGQTNVGRILGVSDNKYVYMPAYMDSEKSHSNPQQGVLGELNYSLMKIDATNPKLLRKVRNGSPNTKWYGMDNTGKVLAEERYSQQSNRHQILVVEGSTSRIIYDKKEPLKEIDPIGMTPDYKSIIILANSAESNHEVYLTMSLKDGKISDTSYSREDADIEHVFTDLNNTVDGIEYTGFTPTYKFFNTDFDAFVQKVMQKFPEHSVKELNWTRDLSKLVVYVDGPQYSGEYYLFDRSLKPIFLAAARPNIKSEDIHPVAKTVITAKDGLKIPTLLTIPKNRLSNMKNLPAIILPHGGPASMDKIEFGWLEQAFAQEGYMVVQPQFRGSYGLGLSHWEAGFGEWGRKMQDDITDTVNALIAKGLIDRSKMCIVGWSYGGYAALAGGAFTPDLYKCVVSINGVSSPSEMLKNEQVDNGRNSEALTYWKRYILKDTDKITALDHISPLANAKAFKAPVLLIHGEHDNTVRFEQSEMMQKELKKANKNVELIKLKQQNHHIETPEARLQTLQETIKFVNQYSAQ